jgi:tetratricopeptide (TPR) repeat protein
MRRVVIACCAAALAIFLLPVSSWAAESPFERARNLYDIHEYRLALVLFEKSLAQNPENGEAWDYASWCNRYIGNWESARQGFERAEQLLPGKLSKWVKVGLGETYLGAGAFGYAVRAFTQAIELDPDDEELVTRSLKGLALSHANLLNAEAMEVALTGLNEKNREAAVETRSEAGILLEKNKASALENAAEPEATAKSADLLTDANDRRVEILDTVVVKKEAPEEPSPAGSDTKKSAAKSFWDMVSLGAPIGDVLGSLGEGGINVQKAEEQTRLGSWFYVLTFPEGVKLPVVKENDADAALCVIEEFDGKLLSVTLSSVWEKRKNNISLKDSIFKDSWEKLNEEFGAKGKLRDTGLNTEAQWISGSSQVVTLTGTAGLDGKIILDVVYNDLTSLKSFLENAKKIDEELK